MAPGSRWKYSGGGYTIAQLVIEEVSGQPFAEYMKSTITDPLGMNDSYYGWPERLAKIAATPYDPMAEPIPGPRFTALAAAGFQTTGADMTRFVEASLTPRVLKEETVRLMQRPPSNASPRYGLGYSYRELSLEITHVGHGGANQGWMADIGMVLESKDGLVVFTNASLGRGVIRQVQCEWQKWLTARDRTCRGEIGPLIVSTIKREGVDAAVARYRKLKAEAPDDYDFGPGQLNQAGYGLLQNGRAAEALAIFELNVEMFPGAANPWDSLGEANARGRQRGAGDRVLREVSRPRPGQRGRRRGARTPARATEVTSRSRYAGRRWQTRPRRAVPHLPHAETIRASKQSVPDDPGASSISHGRFTPGTMLGERYRIVGLLGRGGMGEVYRVDDMELNQSVALKFLPEKVVGNPKWLARFRNEVRTAREIAHPNVCRMYDIGEQDGHIFLTMEYVDGEDLSGVLRRMGRPSRDKAMEIARQICLGLAAAHENNVLHRDLKPANIMIDGRGRVRITDFGLAGFLDEIEGKESRAGTPAYMAPEQLDHGQGLGAQRCLRAGAGAVRAVHGQVRLRHRRHHRDPAQAVGDVDHERVIVHRRHRPGRRAGRHAMSRARGRAPAVVGVRGPRRRCPAAIPLAAAIAAGETPSPELVASAGEAGGLRPRTGLALLAVLLILFGAGRTRREASCSGTP